MTKKFLTKVMVAVAAVLMMTSCSKDDNDKATELTPQQKAEAVVQKLKGANSEVVTKKITTDLNAQGQSSEGAVREQDVKVSYSIETTTQDGSPLVTLYVGVSFADYPGVNEDETFIKFVPKVTPVGTDRVKVSSKEIKEVASLLSGNAISGEAAKGNTLVAEDGSKTSFENVTFEYNAKTNTINNLAITSFIKTKAFTMGQKYEYKNLVLKASQKVVPFNESQYKSTLGDDNPNSTGRASNNSTLNGVRYIYIDMEAKGTSAKIARWQFKPYGYHYAKFTPTSDGSIQMELCDANGVTNGGDPNVENKTGFATPTMPMRLYFLNVKLNNQGGLITDANYGHNYLKAMKRGKDYKGGFPGWLFGVINPNGQESKNAEVLTTRLGQDPKYDIAVKTNLPLDFTAKIKIY